MDGCKLFAALFLDVGVDVQCDPVSQAFDLRPFSFLPQVFLLSLLFGLVAYTVFGAVKRSVWECYGYMTLLLIARVDIVFPLLLTGPTLYTFAFFFLLFICCFSTPKSHSLGFCAFGPSRNSNPSCCWMSCVHLFVVLGVDVEKD